MDGYRGRDYYTVEEFKEGCTINFWVGSVSGILGTIGLFFIVVWHLGWI